MTHSVKIYGFGSAFTNLANPNDLDLLIVHPVIDVRTCNLAIACKRALVEKLPAAHVTMLSESEEAHFGFIDTAQAIFLQSVREDNLDADIAAIGLEISQRIVSEIRPQLARAQCSAPEQFDAPQPEQTDH